MEQTSVSERVAMLVQHFTKGNKSAFAKTVGISNQSLGEIVGARQSAPSFAALQKIFTAFPQVSMEWLIMGEGEMLDERKDLPMEVGVIQSTQQIEMIVRETIIAQLGLSEAAKREAEESIERAGNIASLELKILDLRLHIEELNNRAMLIRNGQENVENEQKELAAIREETIELTKNLNGKYQLIMMHRQEEKRALHRAVQGAQAVSEHIVRQVAKK